MKKLLLSVFAVLAVSGAASAQTQILSNRSFESAFNGWNISNKGAGDYLALAPVSGQNASEGSYMMIWNGGQKIPTGVLSQSFNTTAGVDYTLSFDYQKLYQGAGTFQLEYRIVDDLTSANCVAPAFVSDSSGNTGWESLSLNFVGTGNSVTLFFTDQSSNSGSGFDGGLDNVSVLENEFEAPADLTAIPMGIAGIDLFWIEPTLLPEAYTVERSIDGGAWKTLDTLSAGSSFYRDTDVVPGFTYSYRLSSFNSLFSATSAPVQVSFVAGAQALPASAMTNVRDYGTMWWKNGVRGERIWHLRTSRYAMSFSADDLSLTSIFSLAEPLAETVALFQADSEIFPPDAPTSSLSASLTASGSTVAIRALSNSIKDSHLVESGKFFQRRWQKIKTDSGIVLDSLLSGYEICAWPDRVSIVCRVVPTTSVTNGGLQMSLDLQDIYHLLSSSGAAQGLASASGDGYVFLKSAGSDSITVDAANARITINTNAGTWNANEERSVGLVIYPSNHVAETLTEADRIESSPLTLIANQTTPKAAPLSPSYHSDYGYFNIPLRNDALGSDPDRVERNTVSVTNPSSFPQVVRLAFTKGTTPYLAGYSCFLRDMDGQPLGIPVQLSKNWHMSSNDKWEGPWFHGLTMLTVPPATSLEFEVYLIGQNYAGVPAVSHSQLCLVGWNGNQFDNQQWDETAFGSWGEHLVYDPDSALAQAIGTDSRPMLLLSASGQQKTWTGNYGGCDFLRYYDNANVRRFQKRIRTWYQRYGPNLTDVTYAGETDNSHIEFKYSASIYRSNDYVRGRHHIRYDVKSDAPFNRMVFFQLASDNYNYNGGDTHAYGYGDQLVPTADITAGVSTPTELTGKLPWFSTLNCPVDSWVPSQTRTTRGFIVRSWKARINGQDNVKPHFVSSGSRFDLVPPPGVTTLKAGDYVEAVIERVYLGQEASAYYGGDANYTTALQSYGSQHQMVIREAIGNNLSVNVHSGTLENSYPVQIRALNHAAEFSVTGGLGYIPITITGLSDYRSPLLEEFSGGSWIAIDDATAGGHAWQADYNPGSATWELTINVKMDRQYQAIDSLLDSPFTRKFRFRLNGGPTAILPSPEPAIPGVPMPLDMSVTSPNPEATPITVYALSSNPLLIPNQNLLFTGSGTNRTFSFTPNVGTLGETSITLYVRDANGYSTIQALPINVNARLAWERSFFQGITDPNLIGDDKDPDYDGRTNAEEYAANTDPLDASDSFSISTFEVFPSPDEHRVIIHGRAGRAYRLERSLDLAPSSWFPVMLVDTLSTTQSVILEDQNPPVTDRMFYRVISIAP